MGILNWCLYPVGQIDPVQIVSHKSADFSGPRELPYGHPHASWTFPLCLVGIPIITCGHSQWVLVPFLAKTYPATTCPTAVICHVGIPNPHSSHCAPYSLWSSVCPVGLPPLPPICPVGISHSALWVFPFPYALWAFPKAPMPRGHAQRFLFQWRLTLPWHALWAFPMAVYMPCGHSQSWYFILCPIWLVVISTPCGLSHMATNMPRGHFPFCPVGIPIPICPTSSNAPWARATLSFPVNTYPAMTCPAGIPNGCLYALWAFPILIFHIVPHMTCGHQYALWAFPHGHQYALWAFPILPCGYSLSHMPCGHSQQAPMPRGHAQPFLFQWRLTLQWHALRAFRMVAYVPCGHSQS